MRNSIQKPLRNMAGLALFAGMLLPALIYLFLEYSAAQQAVARDAAIQAQIVDQFVVHNPEGWRYAADRLLDRIEKVRDVNSQTRLLDSGGTELSSIGEEPTIFRVSRNVAFHDFGLPVGQLQVGIDMWPKVKNGVLLATSGLLFAAILLALFKRHVLFPLALSKRTDQESQARLRDLLELSADWFWETDAEFIFTRAVRGGHLASFDPESLIGKHYWEIDCDWTADQWATHRATLLARKSFDINYPASVDGKVGWFNIQGKPLFDLEGQFTGYRGTVRDVTERVVTQENLRIAATAFEMQECIMVADLKGCILRVNEAFLAVTGYMADEVVGQPVTILKSERQDDAFYRQILTTLEQGRFWHGEVWNRHKNGNFYLSELTIKGVTSPDGKTEHYVGSFHDITQRREAENNIHQLAFYDPLTHLPNRRLLFDRLHQAQSASTRSGQHAALMFIDLDNFKTLNDTRGHDVGDMLLCEVAARLRSVVRSEDSVVRLGGDEFVVMLENLDQAPDVAAAEADEVGRKLLSCINQPFDLQGQEAHSTPSVGVVLFSGESQSIEQILQHADAAMYQSKAAGRNTLHFYDPEMQAVLEARAAMEIDLRIGLKNGQFRLHYQAQVDNSGNIIGAEALIRWFHPFKGMVSPSDFIPLAEECGLILPLGQWVLDAACTQLKIWTALPQTKHLTLAVNVSARQYHQKDFVERVVSVLDQSGIDPRKLKLELTESLLVTDVEDVISKMSALKARGVCFSLDDFGTGYSSLSYLKRLPLDQLKIDQSFVRDLERDDNDAAICAATIGLAHNLGLTVVAEGVETEAQRHFLSTIHRCNFMQGYLFSKPLPQAGFESLLASSLGIPPLTDLKH
ncbi:MAG: EAL domain-containing protein [Rhodocyclaceae bacterium]